MANQERRSENPGAKAFRNAVQGLFSPDQLQGMQHDLSGFTGPLEAEVRKWEEEGLGRTIGVNLSPTTKGVSGGAVFRRMMYALPYVTHAEHWQSNRFLLLFPGETTEMCIVGPLVSRSERYFDKIAQDEKNASEFTSTFSPAATPFIHPSWSPDSGLSPRDAFLEAAEEFSADVYIKDFSEAEKETTLSLALATARKLKKQREVNALRIDRDAFETTLDPDTVVLLGELGHDLDREVHKAKPEPESLSTALDPDMLVFMDELSESFRRFEEGKGF